MRIFNFGKSINDSMDQERRAADQHEEAKNQDLAGTGGFLTFVKYAVYSVLAALNWHLFTATIHGIWGQIVGITAILSECFAIYCWRQQTRSAGAHKESLRFFAIAFTVVSFVHGSASLYEISGAGKAIGKPLVIYSQFIAFPLIFSLMILGVCILYYTHWSTEISEARAEALVKNERSRANLLTEKVHLANQMEVERARLAHFEEMVKLEGEYVRGIEQFARVKQRGEEMLNTITDPTVRAQVLSALGRLALPEALRKGQQPGFAQTDKDPKA
jgi:hypothetical protein